MEGCFTARAAEVLQLLTVWLTPSLPTCLLACHQCDVSSHAITQEIQLGIRLRTLTAPCITLSSVKEPRPDAQPRSTMCEGVCLSSCFMHAW